MSRFGEPVNDIIVDEFVESAKPKNTKRHDNWAKKIWFDWAQNRANCDSEIDKPPVLISDIPNDDIKKWLSRFILEVKNTDGKEYTPVSLKCLVAAIYRILKASGYVGPSFLSRNSPVSTVVDAKLKILKASGVGLEVKRADCVQATDEIQCWSSGTFNMETSHGLLNAVFFYNGKVLALRGRSEHHDLQIEQFLLKTDGDGQSYVEFWPLVRKTNQGTTKHSKIRSESIKQFDTDSDRSYYKLIKLYLSKLPCKSGQFYRRPLNNIDGPRYSVQVVGQNNLGQMLKKIFEQAGIKDDRVISNHGLRATAATAMFEAGFSQRTISVRTGHISNAVNNYIRDSKSTHLAVSKCLEPVFLESEDENICLSEKNVTLIDQSISKSETSCSKRPHEEDDSSKPIVIEMSRGNKHIKITM